MVVVAVVSVVVGAQLEPRDEGARTSTAAGWSAVPEVDRRPPWFSAATDVSGVSGQGVWVASGAPGVMSPDS